MKNPIRVRFAPSPTGGLHLGGVRTVLFNYLFAKKNQGEFIVRVEDTDQTRFVEGAEEYIYNCLDWVGLKPDESPRNPGPYAPYRQSERKPMYRRYAEQLLAQGNAYYAFDTPEELETMRNQLKTSTNPSPQYDHKTRMQMRNSLALTANEVKDLLDAGTPYVIRIKMPENETVHFTDLIRGDISHETAVVDDKVLLKSDGMPTYHLAVVVDDYLMKITHAFRGEEWLPSAPIQIMLYKYLGWEADMPQWAHLPLILKPDGNGKLSKRDGERLGFPVFAMDWTDPNTGVVNKGFKEMGFLPEAFINMLALLGWSSGTEQELFSLSELENVFSIERVNKAGAKFDYEKAKWFNQQHLQKADDSRLALLTKPFMEAAGIKIENLTKLEHAIVLVKERCHLLTDFVEQAGFLFLAPESPDMTSAKAKWSDEKTNLMEEWIAGFEKVNWELADIEASFTELAAQHQIKKGEVMLPLRLMLVGGKFGPGVFDIACFIGKDATLQRVTKGLELLKN
ncbi:MAG TPA: glutamate--tRNA ligase [Edaphocola sp.]|nr:glutamate--tRNA ligase [Edaphocola sp.]